MSDSSTDNRPDQDAQADYVVHLKSVLASIGPRRGYVSLNKTSAGRGRAIANQKNTEAAWDDAFGVVGAYQLLLDCIVAAQHIDQTTLEVPDSVPDNQAHIYKNLLSVDMTRSAESLPLPKPPKDWQGFYDRVRKLFVDVVVSRLALDQLDSFIECLLSDPKISRDLTRKTLDALIRHYATRHPKYDGYYDLSDMDAISKVIESKSTSIDLMRIDIKKAVRLAQQSISGPAFPSRAVLLKRINDKMSSSNMNHLLAKRWRTTDDLLARSGP